MDEIDYATERMETFNVTALQSVLSRLNGPVSSGVCLSCCDPIEAQRLRANPHARYCGDCAAEEEEKALRARRCGPR
jgi:RNA polymerase-binding transcription factor DksA